jgi:hypothetical protein
MADLDERWETEASVWGTGGRGFESRRSDQNGQDLRWEIRPSGFPHALFWMRNFAYVAPGPDGGRHTRSFVARVCWVALKPRKLDPRPRGSGQFLRTESRDCQADVIL